jgi:hypothetical protein
VSEAEISGIISGGWIFAAAFTLMTPKAAINATRGALRGAVQHKSNIGLDNGHLGKNPRCHYDNRTVTDEEAG